MYIRHGQKEKRSIQDLGQAPEQEIRRWAWSIILIDELQMLSKTVLVDVNLKGMERSPSATSESPFLATFQLLPVRASPLDQQVDKKQGDSKRRITPTSRLKLLGYR